MRHGRRPSRIGAELLDAVFGAFELGDKAVTFSRAGEVALVLAAVTPERVRIAARPARPVAPTPDPKVPGAKMPDPVPPAAPPSVGEPIQPPPVATVVGPRVVMPAPTRVGGGRVGFFGRLRCR